jgi:DnaJ-class molecular chaperone
MTHRHCPFCGNDLSFVPCPDCQGLGWITHTTSTETSVNAWNEGCKRCEGTGHIPIEEQIMQWVQEDCERYPEAWKRLAEMDQEEAKNDGV